MHWMAEANPEMRPRGAYDSGGSSCLEAAADEQISTPESQSSQRCRETLSGLLAANHSPENEQLKGKRASKQKPHDSKAVGAGHRKEFFANVAAAAGGMERAKIEKLHEALRLTIQKQLTENGRCLVPTLLEMKIKTKPPRPARERMVFGKMRMVKAQDESIKKVSVRALPALQTVVR